MHVGVNFNSLGIIIYFLLSNELNDSNFIFTVLFFCL